MSRESEARRRAFDLAEIAARVRSVEALEEYRGVEDDVEALVDLVAAQARVSSLLAKWLARVLTDFDAGRVLGVLREECEVSASRADLAALDEGFPFDEP